jgi:hypothetical protein
LLLLVATLELAQALVVQVVQVVVVALITHMVELVLVESVGQVEH